MKKVCMFLALFSMLFISLACGASKGEPMELKLGCSPAEGYEWKYEIKDDSILKIEDQYYKESCSKEAMGCTGVDIFNVVGLKEGKTTIIFTYYKGKENITQAVYEFTVSSSLELTETHSGPYFEEK
jgi:predicted secreted protein